MGSSVLLFRDANARPQSGFAQPLTGPDAADASPADGADLRRRLDSRLAHPRRRARRDTDYRAGSDVPADAPDGVFPLPARGPRAAGAVRRDIEPQSLRD